METQTYWWKHRHTDQLCRMENPAAGPHKHVQRIFDKVAVQWRKDSLFDKWCWNTIDKWMSINKNESRPKPHTLYKKWTQNRLQVWTLNHTDFRKEKKKTGKNIWCLELGQLGQEFLNLTPKAQSIRRNTDKFVLIKIKSFWSVEAQGKKMGKQAMLGENVCKHTCNKGLGYRLYMF